MVAPQSATVCCLFVALILRPCAGFTFGHAELNKFYRRATGELLCHTESEAEHAREHIGRRELLHSIGHASIASLGALLVSSHRASAAPTVLDIKPLSLSEAVEMISTRCNRRFLYNVVSSDYNFLYHGLDPASEIRNPTLRSSPPCDLLDAETYGSQEAASYFASLDKEMKAKYSSPVLPSNAHLATTCPKAAAEWGIAASIWPIGEDDVHFAWFEDGGLFWPRKDGASQEMIIDGKHCGRISLDDALRGDNWEVLFRADNGFVAVPAKFEEELRKGLRQSFAI